MVWVSCLSPVFAVCAARLVGCLAVWLFGSRAIHFVGGGGGGGYGGCPAVLGHGHLTNVLNVHIGNSTFPFQNIVTYPHSSFAFPPIPHPPSLIPHPKTPTPSPGSMTSWLRDSLAHWRTLCRCRRAAPCCAAPCPIRFETTRAYSCELLSRVASRETEKT